MPRRSVPVALVASLLLALALAASASAATRTFKPLADASVRQDAPSSRSGTKSTLRVASDPRGVAYLRFRPSGLRGRVVQRALLRLYVTKGSRAGLEARRASGRPWSEALLDWNHRPAVGPVLAVSKPPGSGRTITLDVTSAVRSGSTVVLAVLPGASTSSLIASREARKHGPELVIRSAPDRQPAAPVTAAIYDTRDPAAQPIRHHPVAKPYRAGTSATFARQLPAFAWGRLEAGIMPWDPATPATDLPLANALRTTATAGSPVRWGARLSLEDLGDPSAADIGTALLELDRRFGRAPAYLRVAGRPVVFVLTAATDTCSAVSRWRKGNAIGAYLVMDTFDGASKCKSRPDAFYTDRSDLAAARTSSSYAISPGSFRADESLPQVNRDLPRWAARVRAMNKAKVRWRIVNSFNDWVNGSAVENATEWLSAKSPFGNYLDILHQGGKAPKETRIQNVATVGDIVCDPSNQYFNHGNGVGDKCRHKAVFDVMQSWQPLDAFLMLGDGQYETGQIGTWAAGYDPTFGQLRAITYPVPGNHEYLAAPRDGAGYFDYWNGPGAFSGPAGDRDKGYYSFNLGAWHIVALNTNCSKAGGCETGSTQEKWLRADLAKNARPCTLAFWHQAYFTGGGEGPATRSFAFWRDLRTYGAEMVLTGHNHDYERFRPQVESGRYDPSGGLREFVIGTGGKNLVPFISKPDGFVVRQDTTYGAVQLKLKERSYTWRFQPIAGKTFKDSGSANCH